MAWRAFSSAAFQSASLAVNQTLYTKLNYSAVRDLAPVMLVSSTPLVLVVALASRNKRCLHDMLSSVIVTRRSS